MATWKKFVAVGDSHGDLVCKSALDAAVKFVAHYKPSLFVHLGDAFDFRALRQGIKATESDAFEDLEADTLAGYQSLEKLFNAAGSAEKVYMLGNHEHRLCRTAESHPHGIIRQAARDGVEKMESFCGRHKAKLLPYHIEKGVFRSGKVTFVHGYSASCLAVKQHAEHYATNGGACVMGHLHRLERAAANKQGGAEGFSAGCLADIDAMSYASHRLATSRWRNGWLFGAISSEGHQIWEAKQIGNKWLLPTGVEEM